MIGKIASRLTRALQLSSAKPFGVLNYNIISNLSEDTEAVI